MPLVFRRALLCVALTGSLSAQDLRELMQRAGVQPLRPPPAQPAEQVRLGEMLMFDKILSSNRDIACVQCHNPQLGLSDGLPTSIGTGGAVLRRNAPALWYLHGVPKLFHDGRVSGNGPLPGLTGPLAVQALFPLVTVGEMTATETHPSEGWYGVMKRLNLFPAYRSLRTIQDVANALAAYESATFAPVSSPFDRYVAGDEQALNEAQKRGALLFYGRARCAECHSGPLQSDHEFHNIAAPQRPDAPLDHGQGGFRFRTPILRNVALSGPWTHAGGFTQLADVVRHYINPRVRYQGDPEVLTTLDPIVEGPNPMSAADVADLVEFLQALTDDRREVRVPDRVPSGLPVTLSRTDSASLSPAGNGSSAAASRAK